ncbi:hypothetical protein LCGC14_1634840 [marine sediment metagenome]|uniref:Uncharacterized protein n=1 Tax=marine sediment metagenome TaxID=412755 RepID=A0A0F9I1W1_9ZZZZ
MEMPLHHHNNDGGFYQGCKRCKIERAAPDLINKAQALLDSLNPVRIEGCLDNLTTLSQSVRNLTDLINTLS